MSLTQSLRHMYYFCFSTAKTVALLRLNVTLPIYWQFCLQLISVSHTDGQFDKILSCCPRTQFLLFTSISYSTELVYITYLFTYLFTPWCRVLLEKLTGLQLVKKFPAFHGTRRFITALTSVRHLSLTQSSPYTHIPLPGDPP